MVKLFVKIVNDFLQIVYTSETWQKVAWGNLTKSLTNNGYFFISKQFTTLADVKYRISSHKRPRRLFSFEASNCGTYWKQHLKEGGACSKGRKIIHIKFGSFDFVSFQMTINNYHYGIQSFIFQNYQLLSHCLYTSSICL